MQFDGVWQHYSHSEDELTSQYHHGISEDTTQRMVVADNFSSEVFSVFEWVWDCSWVWFQAGSSRLGSQVLCWDPGHQRSHMPTWVSCSACFSVNINSYLRINLFQKSRHVFCSSSTNRLLQMAKGFSESIDFNYFNITLEDGSQNLWSQMLRTELWFSKSQGDQAKLNLPDLWQAIRKHFILYPTRYRSRITLQIFWSNYHWYFANSRVCNFSE